MTKPAGCYRSPTGVCASMACFDSRTVCTDRVDDFDPRRFNCGTLKGCAHSPSGLCASPKCWGGKCTLANYPPL